jgi:hypothetical protein
MKQRPRIYYTETDSGEFRSAGMKFRILIFLVATLAAGCAGTDELE